MNHSSMTRTGSKIKNINLPHPNMNFALEINAGAWEASKSWGGGHGTFGKKRAPKNF